MKTKVPFAGRSLLLCTIIMGISVTIATRLVELHIIDSGNYSQIAADELIDKERIPAQRGIILDRNEEILTNNIQSATLVADRYHLREITAVVEGLAYNHTIHDERWAKATTDRERRNIFYSHRNRMLKNAERDITREEKEAIRKANPDISAREMRLLDYDPEVCRHYFEQHDRLVAEVLYRFIAHTEVEDENANQPATDKKRGKKNEPAAPRTRRITRQDIIDKIAQPHIEEHNRKARAEGKPTRRFRNEIVLARNLSFDTADKIKAALKEARLRGIMVQSDLQRSYVMPDMLSHVLGYVNHENKGMSGVEAYFHSYLAGVDGMREYRHNARGQVLPNEDDRYMAPKHGLNLKLTIDMRIQTILEQELDKGMRHFRAKNGCMIAVEPKTGDILAMVSRPAFNLNTKEVITHEGKFERGKLRTDEGQVVTGDFNFACQTRYEPGSTFKVIAVTTALEKKVLSIHSPVSCEPFAVGGDSRKISDRPFNYHVLPMWGVLAKSSNPGAANIALKSKWPNFKEYITRYGLDKPVGLELPSGGACLLADGSNIVNFSRIAYGYSVAVSPLHMAMVYATIANNGVRMKPRLIEKIISENGDIYDECRPQEVCRVMSDKTAADLRYALETVTQKMNPNGVKRGTATAAAIPGFRIGGKTGTAKKVKARGGYYDNLYTVSFAGILPVDDPQMVIMTVIDEPHPRDCNPGGGTVAAPIFRAAAERIINVLNLAPSDPEAYEKYLAEKGETEAEKKP